jgi:hypothetical protein
MKAPPLRPAAVTAFPAPPIDVLPYTVMEWEWFEAELAFGQVEGWMRDTTVEGDRRKYRFEVQRGHNGEPRAIVSACDPENSNPFDDRDRGQDRSFLVPWRGLKGLPAGAQEKRLRSERFESPPICATWSASSSNSFSANSRPLFRLKSNNLNPAGLTPRIPVG